MVNSIIVCTDMNFGIGINNRLPWKNKIDMNFFKSITKNSICIMGRKTYQSIKINRPYNYVPLLQDRLCIIVSNELKSTNYYTPLQHNKDFIKGGYILQNQDTYACETLDIAYNFAKTFTPWTPYKDIFFIGGVKIFEGCVPYVDKIYLNMINSDYHCDTFFPKNILEYFKQISSEKLGENLDSCIFIKREYE